MPLADTTPAHQRAESRCIGGRGGGKERPVDYRTLRYVVEPEGFAIPGSIRSPHSIGCHHLIKQGTLLVDDVTDIVDELHSTFATEKERVTPVNASQSQACVTLSYEEREVFLVMRYDPIGLDDLDHHCRLGVEQLLAILVALELKGVIAKNASNCLHIE